MPEKTTLNKSPRSHKVSYTPKFNVFYWESLFIKPTTLKLGHELRQLDAAQLRRVGRCDHAYDATQLNWTKREMFRIRETVKIQWSRVESRRKSDHIARRGVITLTTRLISTRLNSPQQLSRVVRVITPPDAV